MYMEFLMEFRRISIHNHFQRPDCKTMSSHSLLENLHVSLYFLMILPLVTGLCFNFTSFSTGNASISYENDSNVANGAIQLTRNLGDQNQRMSFGRATYYQKLQLWDNASGFLADFTTHFSFAIDSQHRTPYGDGMAFFLAPKDSKLPAANLSDGSTLGLTRNNEELNTTEVFVAVEFDIYNNSFDPPLEHVGIDINSLRSNVTIHWLCDVVGGKRSEAWISYNSSTHNLSVVVTGFSNNSTKLQHLSLIVDFRKYLPEWVTFGFSAATGYDYATHKIYSWEFSSTTLPTARNRNSRVGLIVGLSVGGILIGGFGLVLLVIFLYRKRRQEEEEHVLVLDEYMNDVFERGAGPKKFSYNELARATSNFNDEYKLGEGGFGGVYKGFLKETNSYVAVKRVSRGSQQGIKEYAAEVNIISRLRHRNLVQLIGWCHEKRELMLVYEFLPNGTLHFHLYNEKILLTWEVRYKIAKGIASGLLYLHEEWEQCVVHRDIKPSNVMLDLDFNAKLGDFGLARLVDHEKGWQTTILAGTMGYLAPECCTTGKASRESDIYSFGVVALEIACGRKPINHKASEEQIRLVHWVWQLYSRGNLLQGADSRLLGEFDEEQMRRLMIVGLWCTHPDEKLRPSIRQSIQVLDFEAPLPALPSEMPTATYSTSQQISQSSFSVSSGATDFDGSQKYQSSSFSYNTNSSLFLSSKSPDSSPSAALMHTI